jgi:hypothetical protein
MPLLEKSTEVKKVFILQGWLIPFWIANFVVACVEA